MRKILSIVAALVFAFAANATIWNITPTHCFEGERTDGYTLYVELARGAQAGDTIVLADGEYLEGQSLPVNNNIVVMAAEDAHPVVKMTGYFNLNASAKFEGIKFQYNAGDGYCMYFRQNAASHDSLVLENCEFEGFTNYAITSWEDFHVDAIIVNNCYFHNLAKGPLYLKASGREDLSNTCDKLQVTNCTFNDIDINGYVSVIDFRNNDGGSWVGNANELIVDHCTFYNIHGEYNRIIMSYKSANTTISNCIIAQPEDNQFYPTYNYGGQVLNTLTFNTKSHRSGPTMTNNITGDPLFVDAANGNFKLGEGSPALGAASDGSDLGDPRWNVEETPVSSDLTLYLRLSADWAGWPARYAIYTWKEGVGDMWVAMTAVDGENNLYTAAIPADNDKLIFVRLNGETTGLTWDDKWSQTDDLDFPEGENNLFTVTAGGTGSECTGVWSVYGAPYVPQHADGYYLVGEFGGVETWGVTEERAMTLNTAAVHEEYMITVTLAEGDEFKVVKSENDNLTWYPNEAGNYVVDANHAGAKTIYFRPDGLGDEAFYQGVIYVAPNDATAIDNAEMGEKAVKLIENGQLFIDKNGVRYNINGAVVR